MNIGALVEGNLLALQIGKRVDRRVLRYQDRFALWRRRLIGHVDKRYACGLGENRRRFAGMSEIDCAGVERFKERRSRLKLPPVHFKTKRCELAFKSATALEQNEIAVFLVADGNDFIRRRACTGQESAGHSEEDRNADHDAN